MSEPEGIPAELSDPAEKLVLIVDDDVSIVDLVEHVVRKEGFRVERAADGQEAVAKARELKPHLMLLDFMLPGMGGYEVVKELQAGDTAGIPIVVVTGRHLDRSSIEMIRQERNVRDFMEKPIKPAFLTAMIHRLLKTRPPEITRGFSKKW